MQPPALRSRCFRPFSFVVVILFLVASAGVQAQPLSKRLRGAFRGKEAIAELGNDLPAVAHAHGLTAEKLDSHLRNQRDLAVDPEGSLLFICEGMAVTASALAPSEAMPSSSATAVANADTTDAFQLHSFPGAQRVIYLDFNGHTTSGTQWNSSFTGGASIVSQTFNLDGSPSTFNASEQSMIRRIWQRVAEDFSPFAIDVTTEDPGIE